MLNRFEKILGLAEMVNLNRKTEDDDEEGARKAAEDLDEIALGQHERKASTRLKLDLDLGSGEVDVEPIRAEVTYPEWDWKRRRHHRDHCRVIAEPAAIEGEEWRPDEDALRRIRLVRRQFEAMRPRRQLMTGQPDGDELDLSALVRARSPTGARAASARSGSTRPCATSPATSPCACWWTSRCPPTATSRSAGSWMSRRRRCWRSTHGLAACGDEHAILTFTSHRRQRVDIRTVKDFEERAGRARRPPHPGAETRQLHPHGGGYPPRDGAAGKAAARRTGCCWC